MSEPILSFKELTVWKRSMELAKQVYLLTESLPASERYGLVDQMRRSAVSIPSNIAEGRNRGTRKDFAQFLRIAIGSAAELETQLLLCEQIHSLSGDAVNALLTEVQKMLSVMHRKLTARS